MGKRRTLLMAPLWIVLAILAVGCTGISIAPSCPSELQVGESSPVAANELEPGAIPEYLWEAFPETAGTFADPTAPDTTFQALAEGEVVIRLTASDGIYQVVSQCTTRISGLAVETVSLNADPNPAEVGETVTLSCTSIGDVDAAQYRISLVEGPDVELTEEGDGVMTFTADEEGELVFDCIAVTEDGTAGEPAEVTVSVAPVADDNVNDNDNVGEDGNENDNTAVDDNVNDNALDNENDNEDDNGGRRPSRPR